MKHARLTALALALTLAAALVGVTNLHTPKAHHATPTALSAPVVAQPEPLPTKRASRSRPAVVVKPKVVQAPVRKVTPPAPVVHHHHPQAATRRLVAPSHYGRTYDVTMYCGGGTTASGKTVREGMVATLDRSIPFGTVVHIEGLGSYVVEDRIGHGSEFDIYNNSCESARTFGRHHLAVTF